MFVVDKQINELLKDGVIKPSNSDFASPIILTKKKKKGNDCVSTIEH